jgi:hypothetical protein
VSARLLRAVALAIVVVALIDPVIRRQRPVPPVIALHVAAGAEDLAAVVRDALAGDYAVAPAPVAGAAAQVVVGEIEPPRAPPLAVAGRTAPGRTASLGFVVLPEGAASRPAILVLRAPRRASSRGRVPVQALLRPGDAAPDAVVELRVDGLVTDRRPLADLPRDAAGRASVTSSFAPAAERPHRVAVTMAGARAETLVSVDDAPWRVLVYDPRPSWSSTFVRRALESDARFAVAARIDTSPRSMAVSGALPGLANSAALDELDAIVVGAPDELDDATVATLRRFLRARGGAVVAMIDDAPGAVADLSGSTGWSERLSPAPARLRGNDGETLLQASEMALPAALPAGARLLAGLEVAGEVDPTGAAESTSGLTLTAGGEAPSGLEPVVWQRPVGRGLLVVSGALDAWRYRAADAGFDDFWRRVIAAAAAAAPPPLVLRIDRRVARPGESVVVEVTLRDIAAAAAGAPGVAPTAAGDEEPTAHVDAHLEGEGFSAPVRLWPGLPGTLRTRLPLPLAAGSYRLVVEADGAAASADLLVTPDAAPPPGDTTALLDAWATAHGGALIPATRLDELRSGLAAAVAPELVNVETRPMRSGWWILPFVLALGGEWWLRRRRGER